MRHATRVRAHLLVSLLYVLPVLWGLRSVLHEPERLAPVRLSTMGSKLARLDRADERFVVGTTIATTRRLLDAPRSFLADGACHPLPNPFTLGEHMIGESLLAVGPYLVWRDPLLAYNTVLALSWWLAAVAMYALAFFWTRDVGAAFVAGLLFAFHPARLGDPGHPYLYANQWLPLVLLFAHRTFAYARWSDALALAVLTSLQLLESFHRVLGLTIVALVYGSILLVRFRRDLPRLWPKLIFVVASVGLVARLVFGPYLETRATFGVLAGRVPTLLFATDYLPRGSAWPGWITLGLGTVGIVDRLRKWRPRDGYDPRWVLLLAGILVAWCSVRALPVPFSGPGLASPLLALVGHLPGLDAVRTLGYVWFDTVLVAAFLAGYGVLCLTERLRPVFATAIVAALVAGAALESNVPSLAQESFAGQATEAFAMGVNAEQRALYNQIAGGAVLDLPLRYDQRGATHDVSYYVFLRAYHDQPAAACYNSFLTPVQGKVAALAARLPDASATAALYAQGFRWIVVHDELVAPDELAKLAPLFADRSRTELVASARHRAVLFKPELDPARTYEQRLYRLSSPAAPSLPKDGPR